MASTVQDVDVSQPYESLAAELHDAFQDSHGPSPEIPLMHDFLERHPGRSLEIGCGSGRLLLPLLELGHSVEGLELSSEMVTMAQHRANTEGLDISIHEGDMSAWSPQEPYASLLAPSFTLQLAEDPLATLKHWHDWLQTGGGLYITTFVPYGELIGELPENEWYLDHEATLPNGDDAILETRHELSGEKLKLTRQHRYQIKDQPETLYECSQTIRWGEPMQWQEWLETAGFEVAAQFLDWDEQHIDANPGPDDYDGIITTLARKS